MELGIAYVCSCFIHRDVFVAVHGKPFSECLELNVDLTLLVVLNDGKAVGIILLHEHSEYVHELSEYRDFFYRSRIEEIQIVNFHELLENKAVYIRMCIRCNEERLFYELLELTVIEETLEEINVEKIDESDA